MKLKEQITNRIKIERLKREWTLKDLTNKMKVEQIVVSKIENCAITIDRTEQ